MSRSSAIGLGVGLALLAGAAGAQPSAVKDEAKATILVTGHGDVTRPPDFVIITGVVRAEARDQLNALREMSKRRDEVEAGLKRLAGASTVKIETGDIAFKPIVSPDCPDQQDGEYAAPTAGKCAPIGIQASVKLTATLRPAASLGAAASLAVQLGLASVELGGEGVDDTAGLAAEASRAAYADARRQADLLALAAGQHLGKVVRIQNGPDPEGYGAPPMLQQRAAVYDKHEEKPLSPEVALKLTTTDVHGGSTIVVVFELDR